MLSVLKSRQDENILSRLQHPHQRLIPQYPSPEIGSGGEINIELQHVIRSSEQSGDISMGVELS
jgi:hypothetical protein